MLYDEAIKQLGIAIDLLELKNQNQKIHDKIEQIGKATVKAEEIITELMVSLDFDNGGEIAKNLFSLYSWFNRELLEANMSQDQKRIKVVRSMLTELRGTWAELAKKNAEPANHQAAVGLNIAG
jgi:flagellar protein FliS